jgi:hypothetical protein
MPRLLLPKTLSSSGATSLALAFLMVGCGDDTAGAPSSDGTTGGDTTDETTRGVEESTTDRTDTTGEATDTTGVDTTIGDDTEGTDTVGTTEGECDCEDDQVCDRATNTCVGCLGEDDCDGATPFCDDDEKVCVECLVTDDCNDAVCHPDTLSCVACLVDDDCDEALPICDTDTSTCVGCLLDGDCAEPTPICDVGMTTCVGCVDNDDCDGATPICDPNTTACVGCLADNDCQDASAPVCDTDNTTCVACVVDDDCQDASAPVCDTDNTCVGCLDDDDCQDQNAPVCDTDNTTCVGCLVDGDCSDGAPACDGETTTCVACTTDDHCDTEDAPACNDESNACVACTTDDHCGLGYCCDNEENTCSACLPPTAHLMIPDSSNARLVLINPTDGSLVDDDYFALVANSTPLHALQIEEEIWVSEQLGDRVSRWSLTGVAQGEVQGIALDNVRGMARIENFVYVTNDGTNNGAPGPVVVVFDLDGDYVSHFPTTGLAPSPYGILAHGENLLVSSSQANDDIHEFTLAGGSVGAFHNSTSLNFAQQMTHALNGDILVAGFTSNNIVRLHPETGAVISQFTAVDARGVYPLANGNILWSGASGIHVYDPDDDSSTPVYEQGQTRYIGFVELP